MGFCDYITLEKAYLQYGLPGNTILDSKSLYASSAEFRITPDGKLVERLYRYEDDPKRNNPFTDAPLPKQIPLGERVIEYHGDIVLHYSPPDRPSLELVARFSHGRLEWLRPLADYPEVNRALLVEQGAR